MDSSPPTQSLIESYRNTACVLIALWNAWLAGDETLEEHLNSGVDLNNPRLELWARSDFRELVFQLYRRLLHPDFVPRVISHCDARLALRLRELVQELDPSGLDHQKVHRWKTPWRSHVQDRQLFTIVAILRERADALARERAGDTTANRQLTALERKINDINSRMGDGLDRLMLAVAQFAATSGSDSRAMPRPAVSKYLQGDSQDAAAPPEFAAKPNPRWPTRGDLMDAAGISDDTLLRMLKRAKLFSGKRGAKAKSERFSPSQVLYLRRSILSGTFLERSACYWKWEKWSDPDPDAASAPPRPKHG